MGLELFLKKIPSPALTVPFPDKFVNRSPSKLAPKVPNNKLKPSLCSFVSFLIAFVTPFNKLPESSKA